MDSNGMTNFIWTPMYNKNIKAIELVQRNSTRYLYFKLNLPSQAYYERINHQNIISLENRCLIMYELTLSKIAINLP